MPSTPCLLAVYADWWGCGRNEFVEAMLTIAPPPPCASIWRISYFMQRKIDFRLTAMIRSNVLLLDVGQPLPLELDGGGVHGAVQPAERLDRAGHECFDRAGVGDVGGDEAAARHRRRRSARRSPGRASAAMSDTTTLAPASAKAMAIARPIPPAPPVTSATFPAKSVAHAASFDLSLTPCSTAYSDADLS